MNFNFTKVFFIQTTAIEALTRMTGILKDAAIAFDGSESVTEVEQGAGNLLFALVNLINSSADKIRNGSQLLQASVIVFFSSLPVHEFYSVFKEDKSFKLIKNVK